MNKLLSFLKVGLLSLTVIFFAACEETEPTPTNIVEVAQDDDRFTSLVAALERADLVSTLIGGEFTVFAPTNDAFSTYLNGTALEDVPVATLRNLLLNHVVAGSVGSTSLTDGYVATAATEASTGNNISLLVNTASGVTLNGDVTVTEADINGINGIIHVVNKVIEIPTVVDIAVENGGFTALVSALTRQDLSENLVETLSGDGPFTVFAPSDAAFADLLASNPDWNNVGDIPAGTLEAVLKYHVVVGSNVLSSTLTSGDVTTYQGSTFSVNVNGSVTITDGQGNTVTVVATDIQGGNGVVHVIDGVLLP